MNKFLESDARNEKVVLALVLAKRKSPQCGACSPQLSFIQTPVEPLVQTLCDHVSFKDWATCSESVSSHVYSSDPKSYVTSLTQVTWKMWRRCKWVFARLGGRLSRKSLFACLSCARWFYRSCYVVPKGSSCSNSWNWLSTFSTWDFVEMKHTVRDIAALRSPPMILRRPSESFISAWMRVCTHLWSSVSLLFDGC